MKRLRALIAAHEFSPCLGSECAIGWNLCTRLTRYHDVTVLSASGSQTSPQAYREAWDDYVAAHGPIEGLSPVFVDQPAASLRCARLNRRLTGMRDGLGFRPLFYRALDAWHQSAFDTAMHLGFGQFDVVHQLTQIAFRSPGYLWRSGRPFFWGPVGGMGSVPFRFALSQGVKPLFIESLRRAVNCVQSRFSAAVRRAARGAKVVWVITAEEQAMATRLRSPDVRCMTESASPSEAGGRVRTFDPSRKLNICWSGQHVARKALPLLLHATADHAIRQRVDIRVLGDGPETSRWKALAVSLGLANVDWLGCLRHSAAMEAMARADILVHTSVREASTTVIPEALSLGLPIICHNAFGMAKTVTEQCAILVPLSSAGNSVLGFRDAIRQVLNAPDLIAKLSAGALARALELTWEAKAAEIAAAYSQYSGTESLHDPCPPRLPFTRPAKSGSSLFRCDSLV